MSIDLGSPAWLTAITAVIAAAGGLVTALGIQIIGAIKEIAPMIKHTGNDLATEHFEELGEKVDAQTEMFVTKLDELPDKIAAALKQ